MGLEVPERFTGLRAQDSKRTKIVMQDSLR